MAINHSSPVSSTDYRLGFSEPGSSGTFLRNNHLPKGHVFNRLSGFSGLTADVDMNSSFDPTDNRASDSKAGSSGIKKLSTYKRRRPHMNRRKNQGQQGIDAKSKDQVSNSIALGKRKAEKEVKSKSIRGRRLKPLVVPNEGPSNP
ncbi:unnamed protein product [Microthlaspi erraticum]|uniref:Uncharacterized protein n=1 Tax=Microthlaspi erraticum TaxID=1685480 RepID=A0A6D2I933_9BRAS|nr:unnamed protein product [Microthlaspi erraticum]